MSDPRNHLLLNLIASIATLCMVVDGAAVLAQAPGTAAVPLPPPPTAAAPPAASLSPLAPLRLDPSVRIKDIAFVEGDRVNHVNGEGLVFGLSGTGGKSQQTIAMVGNYYLRKGIRVGQGVRTGQINTKNISAVMVSGKIPANARPGETILVTVSVADDATSLRGGTLNQTALRGIDDEIYAIAQGAIIGGGISAAGAGASVQKNHPTVGVCEAIVERAVPCERIVNHGRIRLILRNKSYSTATAISNQLNRIFPQRAWALNSGTVEVLIPSTFANNVTEFISTIGNLRVEPDSVARVVINQKTGSIVLGHNVKIAPVLFANENIVIATTETPIASQPNPLAAGDTVVLPRTGIDLFESGGRYNVLPGGMTVGDLATALNSLAVSPTTLIGIMTTLRNQGALKAELVIE